MADREHINEAERRMERTISYLKNEYSTLKAGRANPQILERIYVDYYGTRTPITQVGNVSAPEPRVLVINLWDSSMLKAVEKAIQQSDLGINPTNDGKVIRLIVPELTEERRKELSKVVNKACEEAKVAIRAIRRETNEVIRKMQKNSEITEDDAEKEEKETQKLTDKYVNEVDDMAAAKVKEIMSV
ncbi:MAG: ribosome recycling factor [Christensenellales bacterium]|jgi:ribosome recycling factor